MSRTAYAPPRITRHEQTIANTFGTTVNTFTEDIDGIRVKELARQYGSPVFVFSERTLRRQIDRMRSAFQTRYPRVRFAWSYKTNYLDAICSVFHQEGWDAEVVSDLEYAMARRLGIPGSRIICNGAYKQPEWCRDAVRDGALIQVDHGDEISILNEVTADRQKPLPVGMRVNLAVDTLGPMWNRFGFNMENGEALEAAVRITACRGLRLTGLHCHLGTFITMPQAYAESARKLCTFARSLESMLDRPIAFLNLGGGFPSGNSLMAQDGSFQEQEPDFATFAEAISSEVKNAFRDRNPLPEIVMESGRALVDDSGSLVATVVGTRRLSTGERGIVIDAGVNILYTAHWYFHRVVPTREVAGYAETTTIHGPLCMNIDTVRRAVPLAPVVPGDHIIIRPVGAYNVTQWMQFSQLRPAVVMIGMDGNSRVIRRRETIEDVKGPECGA
ncbi:MAG TPA: alanine racemase [Bryobacteraceae bacterium]|nr:alanine racemase [Bryobacteraceae bacterium]